MEQLSKENALPEAATPEQDAKMNLSYSSTNDNTEQIVDAISVIASMAIKNLKGQDIMYHLFRIVEILDDRR